MCLYSTGIFLIQCFPPILLLFHVLESIQIIAQHTNCYASMFVLCKQTIGIFWPGCSGEVSCADSVDKYPFPSHPVMWGWAPEQEQPKKPFIADQSLVPHLFYHKEESCFSIWQLLWIENKGILMLCVFS